MNPPIIEADQGAERFGEELMRAWGGVCLRVVLHTSRNYVLVHELRRKGLYKGFVQAPVSLARTVGFRGSRGLKRALAVSGRGCRRFRKRHRGEAAGRGWPGG